MALKENYKDDILDTSQNVKRKYQMENNGDGTVSFTDVTEYTQQGDSFGSGDINATNSKVNTIDSAVTALNANLDGFKFYPTGTQIVGLISDDSAYTDEDGNYVVWGTATAEQLVADNPNTYKAIASTEDTRGKAGADTACPFKSKISGLQYIDSKYSMNNAFFRSLGINNLKYKDKYLFVISHWNNTANEGVLVNGNRIPLTTIGYASGYSGASFGATSKLSESDIITAPSDYGFNAQLNILSDYPFELIHVKSSSQVITQNHKKWIGFLSLNPSYYNTLKVNGSGISGWTDLQNSGGTISLSFKDLTEYIHIGDTISADSNGALLVGIDY